MNGIFFLEQCLFLKKAGHNVQVVVPPSVNAWDQLIFQKINFRRYTFEWYKGIYTIRLSYAKKRNFSFFSFFFFQKKIQRPDIIHAHGILHGGRLAVFFAKKWKVPVILTEHSSIFVVNKNLIEQQFQYIRDILQNISSILVVGESLKKVLSQIVPSRNIKIIGNPVDTSFFSLPQFPKKEIPFIFSVIALFSENKAIDIIIKAFARVFIDTNDIFLFIGGCGLIERKLKELSIESKVDKKIFFLGELTKEGVRDLLWTSHVHVSASYFETFGINMIEALSCGVPVIATKSGGPEFFINSKNGILVSTGDVEELSCAMLYIYNNYCKYDTENIRKECKQKFDAEKYTSMIVSIYKKEIG
ncbi:MAG: glycosyltransferase [Candidatus Electronema sp. VV]